MTVGRDICEGELVIGTRTRTESIELTLLMLALELLDEVVHEPVVEVLI